MIIGIESSCDESAVAVFDPSQGVLLDLVSSQVKLHAKYGGVVPNLASREHVKNFVHLFEKLKKFGVADVKSISVTSKPGLPGCLNIGIAAAIKREMNRMHSNFEGLMKVEELPGALFVIDVLQEHIAVAEARKIGIPVMAVVDTNSDPTVVDHPIMCNDDSVKAIRMVIGLLIEGIQEGISIRGERKSSKRKLISSKDLVKIEPEVSVSEEILKEADSKCDEETVDSE